MSKQLPREKFLQYGITSLEEYELLALILGSGIKGTPVTLLSAKIYAMIQSNSASLTSLLSLDGINIAKAGAILAALELGRRICNTQKTSIPTISTPEEALPLLTEIRLQRKEHFVALYLDTRNQLLGKETVSIGTISGSLVHPREVFEPAIKYLAAHIVIAHNHPSNDEQPSSADLNVTKRLVEAGNIIGITITDHIIVTSTSFYSFKEHRKI